MLAYQQHQLRQATLEDPSEADSDDAEEEIIPQETFGSLASATEAAIKFQRQSTSFSVNSTVSFDVFTAWALGVLQELQLTPQRRTRNYARM